MPSAIHQHLTFLFTSDPPLAFELARRAGAPIVARFEQIHAAATELDDPLAPGTSLRADLGLVGRLFGRARQGLVVEVQLGKDPGKEWSLPFYRGAVRWHLRCPAWVIVISPDPAVRAWLAEARFAEEPELRPLIITPEMVPPVGLAAARRRPAEAVLAAVMRARDGDAVDHATVALQALLDVTPLGVERYVQLIAASVGEPVMNEIRTRLTPIDEDQLTEWERQGSSFVRGRREGRQEGRQEGLEHLRAALRSVLRVRGFELDAQTLARIEACGSAERLCDAITAAATIHELGELTELPW